jgi:hypothetical protein
MLVPPLRRVIRATAAANEAGSCTPSSISVRTSLLNCRQASCARGGVGVVSAAARGGAARYARGGARGPRGPPEPEVTRRSGLHELARRPRARAPWWRGGAPRERASAREGDALRRAQPRGPRRAVRRAGGASGAKGQASKSSHDMPRRGSPARARAAPACPPAPPRRRCTSARGRPRNPPPSRCRCSAGGRRSAVHGSSARGLGAVTTARRARCAPRERAAARRACRPRGRGARAGTPRRRARRPAV